MRLLAMMLIFACASRAADINALSTSFTDVNDAHTSATHGDRILVPKGTSTWSSVFIWWKRVEIIATDGTNETLIINGNSARMIEMRPTNLTGVQKLKGFRIDGNGKNNTIAIRGPANVWLTRNYFTNIGGGDTFINVGQDIKGTGPVYGLINSNHFHNCQIAIRAYDHRDADAVNQAGAAAWVDFEADPKYGSTLGTNVLYAEGNIHTWTSNFSNDGDGAPLYGHYGGRMVFRYNTVGTASAGLAQNYIDAHGDENERATIGYEVYMNTFHEGSIGTGADQMQNARGGRHLSWSNTFNSVKIPIGLIRYDSSNIRTHDITNSYFWNNTWNGDPTPPPAHVEVQDTTPCNCSVANIIEGTHFFLRAPQGGDTGPSSLTNYVAMSFPHPLQAAEDAVGGGPAPAVTGVMTGPIIIRGVVIFR